MIEILVTLVILMIGLLGIAGLMAQGQRASFEAYQRQQALMLANDMAERIKANRAGVNPDEVATTYSTALSSPAGDGTRYGAMAANCIGADCTAQQTVLFDAAMWDGLLAGDASETASGSGIGPLIAPRGCVQALPDPPPACACAGTPSSRQIIYRVSVAWQGNYPTESPEVADAAATCGRGLYRNPTTGGVAEEFRRLVSVEVATVLPCACPL